MSKWISIEDGLPFDYVYVLVAVCPPAQNNLTHMAFLRKGEWEVVSEKGNHSCFITHWMPLPEPPKTTEAGE